MIPFDKYANLIRCAAVKVYVVDELSSGYTGTGYSHSDCYNYLREAYGLYVQDNVDPRYIVTEGYMLNNDTFISREDALELVYYTGQLLPEYTNKNIDKLYSYMIDYSFLTEVSRK